MNPELKFCLKVVRNGFILTGLYFVSVWAAGNLSYLILKSVLIFFATYCFTELARHYKLTPSSKKATTSTFVFNGL